MPNRTRQRLDLTEVQVSSLVLIVALCWGTVELLFLGARPYALTFISGVILSVPARLIDKTRRVLKALAEPEEKDS